jgi:class 3 adenylate cyclase/tetratricopeptide (TPR) repeat protein
VICPSCGRENPEGFRFCGYCAAPLAPGLPAAEERKVVTVLFCDLVGFTARSDRADPEDVKATLRPFHTRLKREIEAFGGTLDKFIGDAALGVFGSPIAHEDDPERAVRAALAIQAAMAELNETEPTLKLAVRQGINTGEAVVALGTGPQIGESVTGDVVNTASRLQSVASAGAIVVGEPTFRATRDVFLYQPLDPVSVKGKAEPLSIWKAVEARGRIGAGSVRASATPFIGREDDLATLKRAYDRAVREASVRLLTILGEPGVGKSRLVSELSRHVDSLPDLVTWRSGRCLPYGEGITFWALGEIVKAQAGIMESDPPEEALAKLDAVIPEQEPDREWLKQRLSPLVGLEAATPAERQEAFTAWRRFIESMASEGPAVLAFEDIHWADQAMLEFFEHVLGSSEGVPMLLVCTARPELRERYADWVAGAANAETITVSPLSSEQTARLISALLDEVELPAETQALILERAGGNPLYAEEFVRMLRDRGLLVGAGASLRLADVADVPFPQSIQALIAARLDMLSPGSKAILQDASVLGKVFWSGAVARMGEHGEAAMTDALHELSRRELIRPAIASSMEGEVEYSFWHALVRDVCYAQIPRASRAAKHRAAARWLEQAAGERVEDLAEVLAYHYIAALELAEAAGQVQEARDLEAPALRFVVLAGDRALGLDVARAGGHYDRALQLAPVGHPERAQVLTGWADAARQGGRFREALRALEEATRDFLARGDRLAAGRSLVTMASVLHAMGDARQEEVAARAVTLLESEPPGPDLVGAYARMSGVKLVLGGSTDVIAWADRAVSLARELGMDVPARALGFRGYARCTLGDAEGLSDMRSALNLAVDRGEGRDAAVLYNNLAVAVWPIEGPKSVRAVHLEGIEFAERRGIKEFAVAMAAASLDQLVDVGEWDSAVDLARSVAREAEETGDVADLLQARWAEARVLAARGRGAEAQRLAEWLVETARASGAVEDLTAGLTVAAAVHSQVGRPELALELLSELGAARQVNESPSYPAFLCEMVRVACAAGDAALGVRLVDLVEPTFPYHEHALTAARAILDEVRGDLEAAAAGYAEAEARWEAFGVVPERGHALLGLGRCALALERPAEAAGALRGAREIFVRLGAKPALAEADRLLERAASLTA